MTVYEAAGNLAQVGIALTPKKGKFQAGVKASRQKGFARPDAVGRVGLVAFLWHNVILRL